MNGDLGSPSSPIVASHGASEPTAAEPTATELIVRRVLKALDDRMVPVCLLQGYEGGSLVGGRDVDIAAGIEAHPRSIAALLHQDRQATGLDVVQCVERESEAEIVVMDRAGPPVFVVLDIKSAYWVASCRLYGADEVVSRRRWVGGVWMSAPEVEFAARIAKRVLLDRLDRVLFTRLEELYREAPAACHAELLRFWPADEAALLSDAAATGDWTRVVPSACELARTLRRRARWTSTLPRLRRFSGVIRCRARRFRRPTGMDVVLLGPDGVGKSTAIEALSIWLAPVFSGGVRTRTPAPSLVQRQVPLPVGQLGDPHSKRPRSLPASIAKAGYWLIYYGPLYYVRVWPLKARSALVLYHRHLSDALVDPRRYRYQGPLWLLRIVLALSRKPDLTILLDAPEDVVHRRKPELPLAELKRQRATYARLVLALPRAAQVDATPSSTAVAARVGDIIVARLAERTARRLARDGWPRAGQLRTSEVDRSTR